MGRILMYAKSSIGMKQIMAVTGLVWSGFVMGHMGGNCIALFSADAYNAYGHSLITSPVLYPIEGVLVFTLLVHIIAAILVTIHNRKARPDKYVVQPRGPRGEASIASRSMILTGLVIFVFLALHLWTFKYGEEYYTTVNGVEMRDLYKLLEEVFTDPLYVGGYLIALLLLGLHLSHGFSSLFQTFGVSHPNWTGNLQKLGLAFSVVVTLGFSAVPIWFFIRGF